MGQRQLLEKPKVSGRQGRRIVLLALLAAALALLPSAQAAALLGSAEITGPILLVGEWDARFDGATATLRGDAVTLRGGAFDVVERTTFPDNPELAPREERFGHAGGLLTVESGTALVVAVNGVLDVSGFAYNDDPHRLEPVLAPGPVVRLTAPTADGVVDGASTLRLDSGRLLVQANRAYEYLAGATRETATTGGVDVFGNPVGGQESEVPAHKSYTVTVRDLELHGQGPVAFDHANDDGPLGLAVNGIVRLSRATGVLGVGGETLRIERQPAQLEGPDIGLEFRGVYIDPTSDTAVSTASLRGNAAAVSLQDGTSYVFEVATTSLLLALAAGTAYFWPTVRYYGTKLVAVPLYAKLEKGEVLDNELRTRIYEMIKSTPGIHAHGLGNNIQIGWGTLIYHLHVLEKNNYVTSLRDGRHKRFFPVGLINWTERDKVAALRNETSKEIYDIIRANPHVIQVQIAQMIGLSAPAVKWHVARLIGARLIEQKKVGRTIVYEPTGEPPGETP